MAFRGMDRDGNRSGHYATSSGQYDHPPPPEHNITRHPQCNLAEIPDEWLQSLKNSWNVLKASEHVKRILFSYFSNCQNPYASALQIMADCNDFYHSKSKSMASFVIESFASWITPQEDNWRHCLTKELKKEAFNLVTQQKNIALTRLVFKTFHLMENATDYLDQIRFMADCKMYKEACQCANLLNLTKYFTLEDLVLPLVLQDKHVVAEEALVQIPEMQKELIHLLDDMLGRKNLYAEIDNLVMKLDVPDVKYDVVYHPKPLGKLIARLLKRFQLPQELAPNLNRKRTGGALQFLIRKRYKDNINSESWNEMVKEAVGDEFDLQLELVTSVNNFGDNHEALYWAHYFKIPKEHWPYNVRLLDREDPEAKYCQPKTAAEEDYGAEENWGNDESNFHQLVLPDSAFVMVDSVDGLRRLVHTFRHSGVTMAGLDAEWKPAFCGRQSELALVQVATREHVYIVDVVNLAGKAPEVWNELGNCFFRNKEVLKIGFDIVNDLQMIKIALPALGQIKHNVHGYLDLALLWKRLTNSHKLILPYCDLAKNSTSESLSQLVLLTMGRKLNKANQFSNWEQRPLRIGQLRYAALDAFCLLEVYEILRQCCERQNIPFFEISDEIMLNFKGPRKSAGNSNAVKKKASDGDECTTEPVELPWPEFEVSAAGHRPLVLPADLRGVARTLRAMGVDVAILECPANETVEKARAAVAAGRRIACRGRTYRQLATSVPQGYCYNVKEGHTPHQVAEIINAFNIVVSQDDIFSRCQVCNSNTFLKISRDTAKFLHREKFDENYSVSEAACSRYVNADESTNSETECAGRTEGISVCRSWNLIEEPPEFRISGLTRQGVTIQIKKVPADVIEQHEHLFVCDMCGQCFWDGSHLQRFVNSTRCAAALRRGEAML